jgi:hypothetical protein
MTRGSLREKPKKEERNHQAKQEFLLILYNIFHIFQEDIHKE